MTHWPSWRLFAIAVVVWGTTWHAIVYQLAATSPEVGVAIRFALAGALVLVLALWRGEPVFAFTLGAHARFALQGAFMYSLAYLCVYHAERHVASGLVAVGYSASPLVTGVAARLLWRGELGARFVAGGVLCIVGIGLTFWPEFAQLTDRNATTLGAAFTVGAVLLSAVGSLVASRNAHHRLPFWSAMGWGMVYGALLSWAAVAISGQAVVVPTAASWWVSLAYLVLAGSVLAFACYLELQRRLGPGPASTLGVMTPLLALAVSAAFEHYRPDLLSALGMSLALAGNALILRPAPPRAAPVASPPGR